MSYLLTEIALEMLGYKFYDTNGVYHLINFQQSPTAEQSESQAHPDEPSLIEFIDQPSDTEPDRNGHEPLAGQPAASTARSSIKLRGSSVRALAKMMEYEKGKIHNANELQQPPQQQLQQQPKLKRSAAQSAELPSKTSNNLRRIPAKQLTKIMDYENCNVRSQLKKRIEKTVKKEAITPNKEALEICLNVEMKKMAKDAAEMREFRQFVEERLSRIDPRPFENYIRTFGVE